MRQWSRFEAPLSENDLVFTRLDGSTVLPLTVSHAFRRIAGRTGLQGVRLHDLRHSHATLMLEQGVHPKVMSERLGHSTVGITLDVYSHVLPGIQQAAAETFDKLLAGALPDKGAADKTQERALTNG